MIHITAKSRANFFINIYLLESIRKIDVLT